MIILHRIIYHHKYILLHLWWLKSCVVTKNLPISLRWRVSSAYLPVLFPLKWDLIVLWLKCYLLNIFHFQISLSFTSSKRLGKQILVKNVTPETLSPIFLLQWKTVMARPILKTICKLIMVVWCLQASAQKHMVTFSSVNTVIYKKIEYLR